MTLNVILDISVIKNLYSYESEEELLKDIIEYKLDLKYLDDNIRNSSIKNSIEHLK